MAQGVGCRPVHGKVTGSIPGEGTHPDCRFDPGWGACGRQPINISLLIDVSLSFPPPSSHSKYKIKIHLKIKIHCQLFLFTEWPQAVHGRDIRFAALRPPGGGSKAQVHRISAVKTETISPLETKINQIYLWVMLCARNHFTHSSLHTVLHSLQNSQHSGGTNTRREREGPRGGVTLSEDGRNWLRAVG